MEFEATADQSIQQPRLTEINREVEVSHKHPALCPSPQTRLSVLVFIFIVLGRIIFFSKKEGVLNPAEPKKRGKRVV